MYHFSLHLSRRPRRKKKKHWKEWVLEWRRWKKKKRLVKAKECWKENVVWGLFGFCLWLMEDDGVCEVSPLGGMEEREEEQEEFQSLIWNQMIGRESVVRVGAGELVCFVVEFAYC